METLVKRGRGRPKGSKNKPKNVEAVETVKDVDIKDVDVVEKDAGEGEGTEEKD